VWEVKSHSSVLSANRVVASFGDGRECSSQCSWTETLHDRRNSNRSDSETQANTHMSKLGGRKESI